jgi:ABC-type tungstate transport system substrate-binding protein
MELLVAVRHVDGKEDELTCTGCTVHIQLAPLELVVLYAVALSNVIDMTRSTNKKAIIFMIFMFYSFIFN